MKFIAFIECNKDDFDKLIEIWDKRLSEHHTVKTIYPPHTTAYSPPWLQRIHYLRNR